jgi:uncharacterized membrane protein YccC
MTPRALLFGFNCYLAAMAALFIALSFELPNPSWAVVTVFIVSRPAIGGAVWATAAYRFLGSLLGMAAAILIIPNLVDAPELMMLTLAAWVGLCVYLSLLDRSARSYAFVLAGYTATLVALPLVNDPANLFNLAVARMEEILIGIVCAALVHNLILPRSSESVLQGKLAATMADAKKWIAGALHGATPEAERAARKRLAADVTELGLIGGHLRYEPHRLRGSGNLLGALEERLVALLPLLSAVEDRLLALAREASPNEHLAQLVATVRAWVEEDGAADVARSDKLQQECEAATPIAGPQSSWSDLLAISLTHRLAQLVGAWRDCVELHALVRQPQQAPSVRLVSGLASSLATSTARKLHIDHGLALWSALAAALAMLFCAGFAMITEWPAGIASIGIACALCSLFAAMDDPTPIQQRMLQWSLYSIPIAAFYIFAVLPAIDGFGELALVMLPLFVAIGAFLAVLKYMVPALSAALVVNTLIGLQPAYRADFTAFINLSVASIVGVIVALSVTKLMRVIRAEISARRILHAGWRELASLAEGRRRSHKTQFATRMLDRIGLLAPRLAQTKTIPDLQAADVLRDLQIGVSLIELIDAAAALPEADQQGMTQLRARLADYFRALPHKPAHAAAAPLLPELDALLAKWRHTNPSPHRERGLVAAVGLKQNLLAAGAPSTTGEKA